MLRRTKIVATLGPASDDPKILDQMIAAGLDVVRLNFSHGKAEDHIRRAEMIRSLARARGKTLGVLADLQGPKIRIGKFENKKIQLQHDDRFILDANCPLGNQDRVGLDYKDLPKDVARGTTLLLDDGRITLWVEEVKGAEIISTQQCKELVEKTGYEWIDRVQNLTGQKFPHTKPVSTKITPLSPIITVLLTI